MKTSYRTLIVISACLWLASLAAKAQVESDFRYYTNTLDTWWEVLSTGQTYTNAMVPGSIIILGYRGQPATNVTIPSTITGRPVTWISGFREDGILVNLTISEGIVGIQPSACGGFAWLESITFPGSLTNIDAFNFGGLGGWKPVGLFFGGNAPTVDPSVFQPFNNTTVYYLPGTTGWGATFNGIPTALWQPQMQVSKSSSGGNTNEFGFNVNWAIGKTVVVEACTNLANRGWTAIATNTLTSSSFYFTDPQWKNYPGRAYRARSL